MTADPVSSMLPAVLARDTDNHRLPLLPLYPHSSGSSRSGHREEPSILDWWRCQLGEMICVPSCEVDPFCQVLTRNIVANLSLGLATCFSITSIDVPLPLSAAFCTTFCLISKSSRSRSSQRDLRSLIILIGTQNKTTSSDGCSGRAMDHRHPSCHKGMGRCGGGDERTCGQSIESQ